MNCCLEAIINVDPYTIHKKYRNGKIKEGSPSFFCCPSVLSSATVHLLKPRSTLDFFSHFETAGFTFHSYEVLSPTFFQASAHFSFTAAVNETKGSKQAYLIQLLDLDKTQFFGCKTFFGFNRPKRS